MRRPVHVLIVEQDGMLRDGLCALISQETDLAASTMTPAAVLQNAQHPVEPHVMVVDPLAGGSWEGHLLQTARNRWPQMRVLALTSNAEGRSVQAAWRAGADGYLLKSGGRDELMSAIRSVASGRRYISPAIASAEAAQPSRLSAPASQADAGGLSEREREVMKLIARGYRTREIATKLSVSHKTVEKHRTNLMRKLGVRTAAAVAAHAISHGYMNP